jgi:hypothetical protein
VRRIGRGRKWPWRSACRLSVGRIVAASRSCRCERLDQLVSRFDFNGIVVGEDAWPIVIAKCVAGPILEDRLRKKTSRVAGDPRPSLPASL